MTHKSLASIAVLAALVGVASAQGGPTRAGSASQDRNAVDPENGHHITVVTGEAITTKGQSPTDPKDKGDVGIKKQWQRWQDANNDGIVQSTEWQALGDAETTNRPSAASGTKPIRNSMRLTYDPQRGAAAGGGGNQIKPGDVIRICVQYKEWTDSDSDGTIDEPGEVTLSDPVYYPDTGGLVVGPPIA